jgi:superfamily I DNA/RNA helicase/RecB family exonuclease
VQQRPQVRLVRAERVAVDAPVLDAAQRRVVEHRGGPLLVLAGPGTGKTTTLVESVVDRVDHDGLDPEQVLVLTFSRRAAAELRQRIAVRLNSTVREPLARTFHSYAFGLLRREAVADGEQAPRLLTGAEQDLLIRELVKGDVEEFDAQSWPRPLRAALTTRGFAQELRDLLMRTVERGVSANELAELGTRLGRADWLAVARFARQYSAVTALRRPPAYDPAELVRAAVDLLRQEPALLDRERAARMFVVVDEYQDSDPAQEELLSLLAGGGRDLVVVGDPDQSIYAFRGAEIDGIRRFADRFHTADGLPAPVIQLGVSRRCGPTLLAATRRIAARLGGPPAHRRLVAADPSASGDVSVHILATASQEAAFVAGQLREQHLLHGVAWESMAVLVRSAAAIPMLRRGLAGAGVPVAVRLEEVPLVDQPPVKALLDVLAIATGRQRLDAEFAVALLTGPLGGADSIELRRLRQELRNHELATGGGRGSPELLVEALARPSMLAPLRPQAVRAAARLGALLEAARKAATSPGASAEDVLWATWDQSGLADRWSQTALAGGPASASVDRDLDAVVALFDAVARFVDRLPGEGPAGFLEHLRGQQIPADTLTSGAPPGSAVQLMTAHAAKGLEWDVVAVAGVQEGIWPDLRVRGGLLGTETLLDELAGRDDSAVVRQSARLAEERRLFYVAASRARRTLLVTAVASEDTQPSRFLDDLDPLAQHAVEDRPVERVPRGLDLPSVVADLRRVVADPVQPTHRRRGAARQLARLAAAGVPSADPSEWYGLRSLSDDAPLRAPDELVQVSPSKLVEFERCELRWLLKACGAAETDTTRAGVGAFVHDLAEQAARLAWTEGQLLAEFDQRWQGLGLGTGWIGRREYERTRPMVQRLGRWLATHPRTVIAVEAPFDVEVGRARLAGRVDRLERDDDGRLVVVDLKTGTTAVRDDELASHPQLAAYQLAVERGAFDELTGGERRSGGASLLQLRAYRSGAREQAQPALTDVDDPAWADTMLEKAVEGMAGALFRAERTSWCGACPARPSCPAHADGEQVTA